MATNIIVDLPSLYQAFTLRQAMPYQVPDPNTVMPTTYSEMLGKNVNVVPAVAQPSSSRAITWKFAHVVSANDAGTLKELRDIIDKALAPIGTIASAATSPFGIINAANIFKTILNLAEEIANILDVDKNDGLIRTDTFTVGFGRDTGDVSEKWVGYRLSMSCRWINGDTGEEDNKGHVVAQRLAVDSNDAGSPGRQLPNGTAATDVYRPMELLSIQRRLATGKTSQSVRFEVLSHVESDSKIFLNLSDEVTLQIDVADSQAALNEAMKVALAPDGTPTDGEPVSFPGGEEEIEGSGGVEIPYDPGDEHLIAISSEVVPTNREARRLVKDIVKRRIDHVGLELGKRPVEELAKIAEGLGIADAPSDQRALAVAIIRGLKPAGGGAIRTNIRTASPSELEELRREAAARRARLTPPAAK